MREKNKEITICRSPKLCLWWRNFWGPLMGQSTTPPHCSTESLSLAAMQRTVKSGIPTWSSSPSTSEQMTPTFLAFLSSFLKELPSLASSLWWMRHEVGVVRLPLRCNACHCSVSIRQSSRWDYREIPGLCIYMAKKSCLASLNLHTLWETQAQILSIIKDF